MQLEEEKDVVHAKDVCPRTVANVVIVLISLGLVGVEFASNVVYPEDVTDYEFA